MTPFLLCTLTVYGLLVLWFRTSALVEYAMILGLSKRLRIGDWMWDREVRRVQKEAEMDYLAFARGKWGVAPEGSSRLKTLGAFIVRMLTCPACTGLWFSLAVSLAAGHGWQCLAVYGAAMALFLRL